MKSVQIYRFGGPEELVYEEIERPRPGAGEVLVRVHAAGINPVDYKTRAHGYRWSQADLPLILGWDIAGEVVELGAGVTEFAPGDKVYGLNRFPALGKAYAEYTTAPVTDIARKPENLSYAEAAAVPLVALTAWQALFDEANLQAGETVLIHAAAGGVGHLAAQLAVWKGARVIGTASASNADFLHSLGVETVIDYTREDFSARVKDVDVVLDTMSGETYERSFQCLKRGGRIVSILHNSDEGRARAAGVHASDILVHPDQQQLRAITPLLEEQRLHIHLAHTFHLQEAAHAHTLLAEQHVRGKIVLLID